MDDPDSCFGSGSIVAAVIGTFFATCILVAILAITYRQWKRNKGKHLVLVTDPEIVEEAYAFDNPCFKDITPAPSRTLERSQPSVLTSQTETSTNKDATGKWSLSPPWSNIGKVIEKRRTLDDSCLGPKATRVSIVSLRSRDFTGLGFNVCGNMREGIYVKDVMNRGPASESGCINPGDRITSIKISFRSMVYEDALTILSYASPYDVEVEVESGGIITPNSKPTSLLKKSAAPPAQRIYHPLYRSQSIPELSQQSSGNRKKRLFATDLSNDSTLKSCKSSPGSQTLERRHEEIKDMKNNHTKFGIKVLPALDGTVHRIETQNEHNTNLERRHSRKIEVADNNRNSELTTNSTKGIDDQVVNENIQQKYFISGKRIIHTYDTHGFDVPDRASEVGKENWKLSGVIPSEVPTEVHNAAIAARKNRKSSYIELQPSDKLSQNNNSDKEIEVESKSPSKGKRKAPAPPSQTTSADEALLAIKDDSSDKEIPLITKNCSNNQKIDLSIDSKSAIENRDECTGPEGELYHFPSNVELKPLEVIVHHTLAPEVVAVDTDTDVYHKAASLGDLSNYEAKSAQILERAHSLDMTDTGMKKRKAPLPPPEDVNESTEDLTKLDQLERRKLKKSSEWGTLEDAFWNGQKEELIANEKNIGNISNNSVPLKKQTSNLQSETKKRALNEEEPKPLLDGDLETSIDLYSMPLSKKLTQDFIKAERLFDPDNDNALARLVNDGEVVKSLTDEQVGNTFCEAHPFPLDEENVSNELLASSKEVVIVSEKVNDLEMTKSDLEDAVKHFDMHTPTVTVRSDPKMSLPKSPKVLYGNISEVIEKPMVKIKVIVKPCPACEQRHGKHSDSCIKQNTDDIPKSYRQMIRVEERKQDKNQKQMDEFETHFAKPIIPDAKSDDEDFITYELETPTVTVNRKSSPKSDTRINVSVVSTSREDETENQQKTLPSLPISPVPETPQRNYVTEIQVSSQCKYENFDDDADNEEIVSILESSGKSGTEEVASGTSVKLNVTTNGQFTVGKKPPVPPRRVDAIAKFAIPIKATDSDRTVVYKSEYKIPTSEKEPIFEKNSLENVLFAEEADTEKEINPWDNGASSSEPVTNIYLPSKDDSSKL